MNAYWPGPEGEEYAFSFDRGRERRLLVLPALFDEANKLRHFTVETMRRLDSAGIDSFLPDLPGCNESRAALHSQTLALWREAAGAAAVHFGASHVLAIRGGALFTPDLPGWCYGPVSGASLLRALLRTRILASKEAGIVESREDLLERGRMHGLALSGYRIGAGMLRELEAAEPSRSPQQEIAAGELGGPGLWLRAEPGHDPGQADALAAIVSRVSAGLSTGSRRAEPGSTFSRQFISARSAHPEPVEGRARHRLHLTFPCESETLAATLDHASGTTGLLIVSGGNEIRCGAFRSQALLAGRIAAAGHPVFRYDRRGIGDSTGRNNGFRESVQDIAAALAAFRAACPPLTRVVAFGNCDAASALMLAAGEGMDALVLANPWTFEDAEADVMPAAAIRARYGEKLRNPRELARLFTGKVSLKKLASGVAGALRPSPLPGSLAQQMQARLAGFEGPVSILLAERDRTAQAFAANWDVQDSRVAQCPGADHAFSAEEHGEWLFQRLRMALR